MFEATISVPQKDEYLLAHIKKLTDLPIAKMDGISTDISDGHRIYYSVACSDTFRFQLKRLLTESVSEALALGYKNTFLRNYLKVDSGNFFQNVLINTMCVFDKAYDQQIICHLLDVEKPMFIDGYCNFKLSLLKRKWKEIAKLVSENNYILQDKQLIVEFLQYLLESVNCKVSQLSLSLEQEEFLLFDSNNNILPNMCSLARVSNLEEEAALNVLLLKPKHLTVFYQTEPSQDFCQLMRLFDCKLVKVE